jgi:hypothetical protein
MQHTSALLVLMLALPLFTFLFLLAPSCLFASWSFEMINKHMHDTRVVTVPAYWPQNYNHNYDGADVELPSMGITWTVDEIEHYGLQNRWFDAVVDFYPMFCIQAFKFDAAAHASTPVYCCNDTVFPLKMSDVFVKQNRTLCYDGNAAGRRCVIEIAIPRSFTVACMDSLVPTGINISFEAPYQILTSIIIETFKHQFQEASVSSELQERRTLSSTLPSVFGQTAVDSRNGNYGDFVTFHRPRKKISAALKHHYQSLPVTLTSPKVLHRFSGRLTTQELFHLDRLFSIVTITNCPSGMLLLSISHAHSACVANSTVSAAAAGVTLWFGGDGLPLLPGSNVIALDCTLMSPAFSTPSFFPWCIAHVSNDMFIPSPSLSHFYAGISPLLMNASEVGATICKIQGRAALSAIIDILTTECMSQKAPSLSRIDLLRIHVDLDTLASFQKVVHHAFNIFSRISCILHRTIFSAYFLPYEI